MAGLAKDIIFEKRYRLLRHCLFWTVCVTVFGFLSAVDLGSVPEGFRTVLIFTPINILYTYVILYWFVPRFLVRERYLFFFVFYCVWAVAGLFLNFFWRSYVVVPLRTGRPAPPNSGTVYLRTFAFFSFVIMNTIAMFGVFIRMFKYWYRELRQKMQIEQAKVRAELELLRAQLHPHFLFNTLNNLYSLVLERSEKAPDMLMRLSALLSYVLYECKASEVLLEKEIRILKDYIALEQERYGSRLEVSMNFSGDIIGRMVAPMLFQPFVENAFKHGTAEQLGRVWMSIELSVEKERLFFRVINSMDGRNAFAAPAGGIGINNVRRRLELLYPGRHSLEVDTGEEVFIVSMNLSCHANTLSDHR
jgi:two-component system sensor histidine kinase AlgZ